MLKWVRIGSLIAACSGLGCSADADRSGEGTRRGQPGAGGTTGASGAAGGSTGAAGLGDIGVPVTPPPSAGTMAQQPDAGEGECGAVSQTAQNTLQPADIIIGIDTSGSMDDEIAFVQMHLNAFSQQIIDSGVDVHVILIATEGMTTMGGGGLFGGGDGQNAVCIDAPLGSGMCPGDSNPPVYTHVNREVGSNDILDVFISAYPTYAPQLRENSLKTFVAVTDDDAVSDEGDIMYTSADAFMTAVSTLDMNPNMWADWRYSSIYCFTQCEFAAAVGAVHADLVAKTNGVGGDLCLQDFAPVLDQLAAKVVNEVELACDWEIPAAPATETFDAGKTNVELDLDGTLEPLGKAADANSCGDQNGWYYDDPAAPTRVFACPATCTRIQAAQNATVNILFGCETVEIVPQ
jgi:hypothetical protein